MKIGILKEKKRDERRVALRPEHVALLIDTGHHVWVEQGAGQAVGYSDDAYVKSGAQVCIAEEVYDKSKLLLKVKCPLEQEYKYLSDKHLLFTYLHFDENIQPANIKQIVATGVTGIAYEWVENNGVFPLLQPMSELTGAVVARKAMSFLIESKGVLGGRYRANWPASTAMVIGVGHVGANAISVLFRNEYKLLVVDKHPETVKKRLEEYANVNNWANSNSQIIKFDESNINQSITRLRECLSKTDIVICAAVRRTTLPKEQCEFIISREDLRLMEPKSVICDATACTRDFIETCVATEGIDETYVEEGMIHYNCDHAPSVVAKTATDLLTDATFPYIKLLAEEGFENSILKSSELAKAVMCFRKHLTHQHSAEKKHLEYIPLSNLL